MSESRAALPFSAPTEGFSAVVRERTKLVHRAAERAGFISDLLHARATKAGYALFLRNLEPAYAALETALVAWRNHPLLGAFADPRVQRLTALQSDLAALSGKDWVDLPVLPEACAYAAAIAAGGETPGALAGHAYARYLGDLSGGQILAPLLTRTLGLTPDSLAFYTFLAFTDLGEAKAAMRAALDTVLPGTPPAEALCENAVAAFDHNIAVSEAVQRLVGKS